MWVKRLNYDCRSVTLTLQILPQETVSKVFVSELEVSGELRLLNLTDIFKHTQLYITTGFHIPISFLFILGHDEKSYQA